MAKQKKNNNGNVPIEENLQICINSEIESFLANEEVQSYIFPSSLTNKERQYIHKYVQRKGLKSKSHGSGASRQITIFKKNSNTLVAHDATFSLTPDSKQSIFKLLSDLPITIRELNDLKQNNNCVNNNEHVKMSMPQSTYSLASAIKNFCVPPPSRAKAHILSERQKLPIYQYRQHIIDTINTSQVVVISGDTGSGKTTQVPQYILEDHSMRRQNCRIICTQPRRLAAISISDRVAYERDEQIGATVAYQIRLESRIGATSNLIYTTSGFLLRCLIGGKKSDLFENATHIILDEVHERDKFSDFLLIAIKEGLAINPKIKIILMSATIDSDVFISYFNNCPMIDIPGRMYPVEVHHLENVLCKIGYTNKRIEDYRRNKMYQTNTSFTMDIVTKSSAPPVNLSTDDIDYMSSVLEECWYGADFSQFYYLISGENFPIDFQHSETKMTALMIAASKGLQTDVYKLLCKGAESSIVANNRTALDWAKFMEYRDCVETLEDWEKFQESRKGKASSSTTNGSNESKMLLDAYQSITSDDEIDQFLLFSIIKHIHQNLAPGSILVFLPGYDAIVEQNETILNYQGMNEIDMNLSVFMLHGQMQSADQKQVFAVPQKGFRKIILATNIAETSLTIDDVVYVIDCGKVKQKSFDAMTGATCMTATWISQACAKQRMGRAGRTRPGMCFRTYSTVRFQAMDKFTLPEILRVPLTEICLSARIITDTTISEFLSKAIQPPPSISVNQSIRLLTEIGALDANENITPLGMHLVDLPVDVQFGKVLLYSILLKCLDPILTIISVLSVKDPFVLPRMGSDNTNAQFSRKDFAEDSCSDHMVYIKVFQSWVKEKSAGRERKFCRENFISNASMEMICGIRSQILGQLRTCRLVKSRGPGNIHDLNKNSFNWAVVKACLTAGLYPNVCRIDRKMGQLKSKKENKLIPHQTSVLRDKNVKKSQEQMKALPTEWLIFDEKSRADRYFIVRNITIVSPIAIALMAGPINMPESALTAHVPIESDDDDEDEYYDEYQDEDAAALDDIANKTNFIIDEWIQFVVESDEANFMYNLRQKFHSIFLKMLNNPVKYQCSDNDSLVINTISTVLYNEDIKLGLVQPKNVGTRPMSVKLRFGNDLSIGSEVNHFKEQPRPKQTQPHGSNDFANNIPNGGVIRKQPNQTPYRNPENTGYHVDQKSTNAQRSYPPQMTFYKSNDYQDFPPQQRPDSNRSNSRTFFKNNSSSTYGPPPIYRTNFGAAQSMMLPPPLPPVNNYKLLPKQNRYFIVRSTSKINVQRAFKTNEWSFSAEILKQLLNLCRNEPTVNVIIFFHISIAKYFFGIGRFVATAVGFKIECLSQSKVNFGEALSLKYYGDGYRPKSLDDCHDGEEICDEAVAMQFYTLFMMKL